MVKQPFEHFEQRSGFSFAIVSQRQEILLQTKIPKPAFHTIYHTHRTLPPSDRQVVWYITPTFSLVLNSTHVCESRSSLNKIIPNALFEKNRFFPAW